MLCYPQVTTELPYNPPCPPSGSPLGPLGFPWAPLGSPRLPVCTPWDHLGHPWALVVSFLMLGSLSTFPLLPPSYDRVTTGLLYPPPGPPPGTPLDPPWAPLGPSSLPSLPCLHSLGTPGPPLGPRCLLSQARLIVYIPPVTPELPPSYHRVTAELPPSYPRVTTGLPFPPPPWGPIGAL